MSPTWYERLSAGLGRSRESLAASLNSLLGRGPSLDADFWDELEETLILSDMGVLAATEIIERLRRSSTADALPDAQAVIARLVDNIASEFAQGDDPFAESPVTVLVVGVNGTGKTTTVGKIAKEQAGLGRRVVLGSADTFRAAASEQLDIWAGRAGVPVVRRGGGSDPAAVAFDTVARADSEGYDLALIDTAGRLHTSADLMRELQKVKRVTVERSAAPVRSVLVLDATTGQNGLVQARMFHEALGLDALIVTKLDGTSKGGIAIAASRELGIPIIRVGVGEGADDLRVFDPVEFAEALVVG